MTTRAREPGRSRLLARPAVGLVAAILLSQALLGADCVDGTTPDCSDAAAQCGPDLDASDAADTSVVLPDGAGADAAPNDAADAADVDDAADGG